MGSYAPGAGPSCVIVVFSTRFDVRLPKLAPLYTDLLSSGCGMSWLPGPRSIVLDSSVNAFRSSPVRGSSSYPLTSVRDGMAAALAFRVNFA